MDWMEIFTLVTGVIYIYLEVRQKNFMWVVGFVTSAAAVWVFLGQGLYATAALNVYYVAISFWGFYQWWRDGRRLVTDRADETAPAEEGADRIHLNRLTARVVAWSAAVYVVCTAALIFLMDMLGDPMSWMDAGVTMLGAVGTWWLSRSYKEQWMLWVVADVLTVVMCLMQDMYYMSVLYVIYTACAVYGYFHWSRNGKYVG